MSDNRFHMLYRMYSKGHLLYIGISSDVLRRFNQHAESKPFWTSVDKILIEHYDSREELEEAERLAIKAERPEFNQIHAEKSAGWARRQVRLNESLLTLGNRGFGISGGDRTPAGTPEAGHELWPTPEAWATVLAAWGEWAFVHYHSSPFVALVHLPTAFSK